MLWYVEQAVPDPRCNSVAGTACTTINALAPQLHLPEGYAQAMTSPADARSPARTSTSILRGPLRNSCAVIAEDKLTVKAGSIEAAPNVVDIGKSAYEVAGGWNVVTGTVVQSGGFVSAMQMSIVADCIHAGAFSMQRSSYSRIVFLLMTFASWMSDAAL